MPRHRRRFIVNASRPRYRKPFSVNASMSRYGRHFTVKVQNLSKSTDATRIFNKVKSYGAVELTLKTCPDAPANYAYVNFANFEAAQRVSKLLHFSILDNNRITAKIQNEEFYRRQGYGHRSSSSNDYDSLRGRSPSPEGGRDSRSRSRSPVSFRACQAGRSGRDKGAKGTDCNASTSNNSANTVKVSVHGKGVTETDLERYFSMYGSLISNPILQPGQPDYSFINFETAVAAQVACFSSPHCINGVRVTVGLKSSKKVGSTVHDLGIQLASAVLPCNPLVVEKAHKDMARHFKDLKTVKIEPVSDRIIIHVPQEVNDSAMKTFQGIIQRTEAKIKIIKVPLNLCFCPVLASWNFTRKISDLDSKFDIKVELGGEIRSLEEFQSKWVQIEKDMASQMNLSSSSETESTYQWYWLDDCNSFCPYGCATNKEIETAYEARTTVRLTIAENSYVIDPVNKLQTNQTTNKERNIQRKQLRSVQSFTLKLHLSSHEDYIEDVKKDILKALECVVCEKKVPLPNSLHKLESFVHLLLFSITKHFVQATFDLEESVIMVRGKESRVTQSANELQTRILGKQHELGRISSISLPTTWTSQEDNCELKMVPDGSPEWLAVEKLFLGPDFKVQIVKIERIQNKWLWEPFAQAKARMFSKNGGEVNEKQLFHGTGNTSPKDIYNSEQGFDNRMASRGLYGEGAYFAVKSSYSDNYAYNLGDGCKQMFLANVMTGMSCECQNTDPSLKVPPLKSSHDSLTSTGCKFEGERYDSVTAVTGGSRIFVIYELGRVYPTYLITYRGHHLGC